MDVHRLYFRKNGFRKKPREPSDDLIQGAHMVFDLLNEHAGNSFIFATLFRRKETEMAIFEVVGLRHLYPLIPDSDSRSLFVSSTLLSSYL